ncbi:protein LTV1 homolog [Erpetoichthys calabaricus]|uniref:Protein LTV1 homolog n=1 Tax=Erpetoichthys calabaricus TaxID=27687 RepID=A0A8C4RM18_ERPCA|nr:protein LTV1 homolog [Erpetoichthys calabaricus]
MPHRKKKRFIDKKNAVTFHLVHRSQRDPLAADETAPQHVLLPARKADVENRKEEQRKYGVFFDDDYDYLQHLREASCTAELVSNKLPQHESRIVITEDGVLGTETETVPAASLRLPSSVFASEFEEEVGLLNKAAPVSGPRLDMDPDIVAALDEDFDFDNPDNILEDDFILKANEPGSEWKDADLGSDDDNEEEWETTDEESDGENVYSSDEMLSDGFPSEFQNGRPKEFLFEKEETKSHFTEYSLTSSVMRRNEQLTLLDDRFEKFFEQFDDDEIGALDNAELEGYIGIDSERLEEVIQEYYRIKAKEYQKPDDLGPKQLPTLEETEEHEQEPTEILVIEEPKEKWDCESILSTYSNLYNHPKLITDPPKVKPIKVSNKTGIPLDVLPKKNLTAKQVERMERINDTDLPSVSTQPRPKDETSEERKARKQTIKEERKQRRVEKKANKMAFKEEKTRQEKEILNLRTNIQGLKLS